MGILDRFRRKQAPKEQDEQLRPASLPGHVTAYDTRADRGTIELENGQLLTFSSAACGGVQPTPYQGVLVTGIRGTTAAEVTMLEHGAVPGLERYDPPVPPADPSPTRPPRRPSPQPPPPDPSNPELERALLANPDDLEAHLVLGDWLQDRGHPRGELIALMARLEQDAGGDALERQIGAFLREQRHALMGELFSDVDHTLQVDAGRVTLQDPTGRRLTLGWRLGFIASARVGETWDRDVDLGALELLEELLRHPSGRLLRELTLGLISPDGDPEDSYHGALELLQAAGPRPTLRKLFIGDFEFPDEMEMSWTGIGDLQPIWPLFPDLREVILQAGAMDLGRIDLPRLRSFEVRTGGLSRASIRAICDAHWPELERLVVWFGDENYGAEGTIEDVEPLLAGERLPRVTHLGLMNCQFTDEICHALVRSPLAPRLTALDLSMGTMSDEGAEALARGAAALSALKRLNVDQSFLTGAGVQMLLRHGWTVKVGEQNEPDDEYRYVTVGE